MQQQPSERVAPLAECEAGLMRGIRNALLMELVFGSLLLVGLLIPLWWPAS